MFDYTYLIMLDVLSNAVESLVSEELDDSTESVAALQQNIDRLLAVQVRQLASWNIKKTWADNGSRSCPHRLARETGLSVADARHRVHLARQLSVMPVCYSAFAAGTLSLSRVELLVRTNQPKLASLYSEQESLVVALAQTPAFCDAVALLSRWSDAAYEYLGETRSKVHLESRSASAVRTFEGTVDLRALFDRVGGQIFLNEHETIVNRLFEADWAEAKAKFGDNVSVDKLKRTKSQRSCDALVEMAKRSASADRVIARPLITIIMGQDSFRSTCETGSGISISPAEVAPLLDDADIERIIFDSPNRVLEVSHRRSFVGAVRRAIQVRDRHCQHPSGCDVRASKCEVDHIDAYVRSQETSLTNGQLLCDVHNRRKGTGPP